MMLLNFSSNYLNPEEGSDTVSIGDTTGTVVVIGVNKGKGRKRTGNTSWNNS